MEHSRKFFSSGNISVTLSFMCGIHTYTKDMSLQDLHSFAINGATGNKENVIIDMLRQVKLQSTQVRKENCTNIHFLNIKHVMIAAVTMHCPSINIESGILTVKNSNFYGPGYRNTNEILSSINITTRNSQALLDNCNFKENCFLMSNYSVNLTISNSTFQSYKHEWCSIISTLSSIVTLTGYVNFTDSVTGFQHPNYKSSGTAISMRATDLKLNSSLNIATGATVHFINLTCSNNGGAVYVEEAVINIGARAKVVFLHNVATSGGALHLLDGSLNVGTQSNVTFAHNKANGDGTIYLHNGEMNINPSSTHMGFKYTATQCNGGAVAIHNGSLNIDTNTYMTFSENFADDRGGAVFLSKGKWNISTNASVNFKHNFAFTGGAIYLENSKLNFNANAILFYNNSATRGGAIFSYDGVTLINCNHIANFSMNFAVVGGAFFIIGINHRSISVVNSSKLLFYNNSAFQGGALYIRPSSFTIDVGQQSKIQFVNNSAVDAGGAVYSEMRAASPCMFLISDYSPEISFIGNHAGQGIGHHMYGTSVRDDRCDHMFMSQVKGKPYCVQNKTTSNLINITLHPDLDEVLSPVSSTPWRVCLCDSNGRPQCTSLSQIFTSVSVYRGEEFGLPAYVVGYDFGTTVGSVYANFLHSEPHAWLDQFQSEQTLNTSEECTALNYTVSTEGDEKVLHLLTSLTPVYLYGSNETIKHRISQYMNAISDCIHDYTSDKQFGCICEKLLTTPIFITVTLLPGCPPGLTLRDNPAKCSCYSVLNDTFHCSIHHKTGYLTWNNTMWVNTTFSAGQSHGIIYNRFCPPHYCKLGEKTVNIGDYPNEQCASNRAGILCGACIENFSLAIGSSQCIRCPNSQNVALVLAFAAAGVSLVFFILALNLTVTQGLINGLIFYANIVWTHKIVLFSSEMRTNNFLQIFLAWLNLDFGIETCFFVGLNAYWNTWLQFLFPLYIWTIAGVIIVACHYSSYLTNLIGSRAVPLLATLFLLSYMKLLCTIIDATLVAVIVHYPEGKQFAVWYLDGNLPYCQHPHIYLFIVAIVTLLLLWLPYTLLLLLIQPLRKMSHLRPFQWINRLAPVYDAYLSPLKDKHQYWFGMMLLVRGILLIMLTLTSAANPELNVFILSVAMTMLLFFTSAKNVYKRSSVRVFENISIMNLIIFSTGILYKWQSANSKTTLLEISIGFAFAQFCAIIVWSLIKPCFNTTSRYRQKHDYDVIDENSDNDILHERIEDSELEALITSVKNSAARSLSHRY